MTAITAAGAFHRYEPIVRRMVAWIEWRGPLSPADLIEEALDRELARSAMAWGLSEGRLVLGWDGLLKSHASAANRSL